MVPPTRTFRSISACKSSAIWSILPASWPWFSLKPGLSSGPTTAQRPSPGPPRFFYTAISRFREPLGGQALKYYTLLIINAQVNTLFLLGVDFLIDHVLLSKLIAEGAELLAELPHQQVVRVQRQIARRLACLWLRVARGRVRQYRLPRNGHRSDPQSLRFRRSGRRHRRPATGRTRVGQAGVARCA